MPTHRRSRSLTLVLRRSGAGTDRKPHRRLGLVARDGSRQAAPAGEGRPSRVAASRSLGGIRRTVDVQGPPKPQASFNLTGIPWLESSAPFPGPRDGVRRTLRAGSLPPVRAVGARFPGSSSDHDGSLEDSCSGDEPDGVVCDALGKPSLPAH